MESYNSVINRVDMEMRRKEKKAESRSRKRKAKKSKLYIRQADVLLINFGDADRWIHGKRPAVVISSDESLYNDNVLMVIPLFRKPSRDNSGNDIHLSEADCNGLRYEEYASVANIRKVYRRQVIRRIGHIKSDTVIAELTAAFLEKVGEA
jgi:mRNA-degrading endonuclease toxin of MazEF toxin-antitoxin module